MSRGRWLAALLSLAGCSPPLGAPVIEAWSVYETPEGAVVTLILLRERASDRDSVVVQVTALTTPGMATTSPLSSKMVEVQVEQPAPRPGQYVVDLQVCVQRGADQRCTDASTVLSVHGRRLGRVL